MRPLLALAAVLLCAQPAAAAPFTYSDPSGDALSPVAAHDIVSVTYALASKGAARELVVTLKLRAAPASDAASAYTVGAAVAGGGCAELLLHYAPGTVYATQAGDGWVTGDCAEGKPTVAGATAYRYLVDTEARGTSVVWRLTLAGTALRTGNRLYRHVAMTEPVDPVAGVVRAGELTDHLAGSALDTAVSFRRWTIG